VTTWQIQNNQISVESGFSVNNITSSTTPFFIGESGRVGIGTTSPNGTLNAVASSASASTPDSASVANFERAGNAGITISTANTGTSTVFFGDSESATIGRVFYNHTDNALGLIVNNAERFRIDSSGRLLVGTSTARTNLFGGSSTMLQLENLGNSSIGSGLSCISGRDTAVGGGSVVLAHHRTGSVGGNNTLVNNDTLGTVSFLGADGTNLVQGAQIRAEVDGTPGTDDMPGRLVFSTCPSGSASPTERMRITSQGYVFVDTSSSALQGIINTTNTGLKVLSTTNTVDSKIECFASTTNTRYGIVFSNPNGIVGSISTNGSATAFNTSSDYRLKENVVPLTGAANRLNQLQVHRFNFIADPDTTVDGFIAHEAQAVVPECVTGVKDEVDNEGNPVYQGIDQSKLVPLLTAALQEAIGRIETLEAEVAALKAS
jgi:hypothetical protein